MINKGQTLVCGKDVAIAMRYKNPEKALLVHVSLEDKGVNEMVTPGERYKASSSTSRVSTPSFPLYDQQAEVVKRDLV